MVNVAALGEVGRHSIFLLVIFMYSIILVWWSSDMLNYQFSKNAVSETIPKPY